MKSITKFHSEIIKIVGPDFVLTNPNDILPYLHEERGLKKSNADIVVRPESSEELAKLVKLCSNNKIPIVPVGGLTGLVGATVASGGIIVTTDRMNKILNIDQLNKTMTVEAGCILADIQKEAIKHDCLFPLSLGAEGSCRIGGNLATNAGGVGVLRYGNTRDLVLGLEVIMPNGDIWDGLKALRKDNTGYDLKNLLIGSEGTLGIITKAVLKLFPSPKTTVTVFIALNELTRVLELFEGVLKRFDQNVSAFELISRIGLDMGLKHLSGMHDPFQQVYPYYTLIELTTSFEDADLRVAFESLLERFLENQTIMDAVFAENERQHSSLWRIREELPAAQSREGGSIKHDISVPVSKTVDFITEASKRVKELLPGIRPCPFGHIGDGNIHYNLTQPRDISKNEFMSYSSDLNRVVHDLVTEMDGSISAEHGIGLIKKSELNHYASPVKMKIMRSIKAALDPDNIMNPGKIV